MNKQFIALFAALALVSGAQARTSKEIQVQANVDTIANVTFSFGSDTVLGNLSHVSHAAKDSLGNTDLNLKAGQATVVTLKGSLTGTLTGSDSVRFVSVVVKSDSQVTTYKFETTILETEKLEVLDLSFDANGKLTVSALDKDGNVLATLVVRKTKTKVNNKHAAVAAVVAAKTAA